ncbi:hypothetical protein AAMO2058_001626300 [Amorphochlora amoebiformis]
MSRGFDWVNLTTSATDSDSEDFLIDNTNQKELLKEDYREDLGPIIMEDEEEEHRDRLEHSLKIPKITGTQKWNEFKLLELGIQDCDTRAAILESRILEHKLNAKKNPTFQENSEKFPGEFPGTGKGEGRWRCVICGEENHEERRECSECSWERRAARGGENTTTSAHLQFGQRKDEKEYHDALRETKKIRERVKKIRQEPPERKRDAREQTGALIRMSEALDEMERRFDSIKLAEDIES